MADEILKNVLNYLNPYIPSKLPGNKDNSQWGHLVLRLKIVSRVEEDAFQVFQLIEHPVETEVFKETLGSVLVHRQQFLSSLMHNKTESWSTLLEVSVTIFFNFNLRLRERVIPFSSLPFQLYPKSNR